MLSPTEVSPNYSFPWPTNSKGFSSTKQCKKWSFSTCEIFCHKGGVNAKRFVSPFSSQEYQLNHDSSKDISLWANLDLVDQQILKQITEESIKYQVDLIERNYPNFTNLVTIEKDNGVKKSKHHNCNIVILKLSNCLLTIAFQLMSTNKESEIRNIYLLYSKPIEISSISLSAIPQTQLSLNIDYQHGFMFFACQSEYAFQKLCFKNLDLNNDHSQWEYQSIQYHIPSNYYCCCLIPHGRYQMMLSNGINNSEIITSTIGTSVSFVTMEDTQQVVDLLE